MHDQEVKKQQKTTTRYKLSLPRDDLISNWNCGEFSLNVNDMVYVQMKIHHISMEDKAVPGCRSESRSDQSMFMCYNTPVFAQS